MGAAGGESECVVHVAWGGSAADAGRPRTLGLGRNILDELLELLYLAKCASRGRSALSRSAQNLGIGSTRFLLLGGGARSARAESKHGCARSRGCG